MLHAHSTRFWRRRGGWLALLLVGALLFTGGGPRAEVRSANSTPAVKEKRKAFQQDEKEKQARDRKQSQENLKLFGLALHGYHDVYGRMPGPAILSKDGKPLLSWRVAILPFIEQQDLYKKFKLDEPWDSPNNRKLLKEMPKIFETPGVKSSTPHVTFYQGIVGKDAPWRADKNLRFADFTDGLSNTILLVEGSEPVPWTKPTDIAYEAKKALPKFGWLKEGFNVLMADGSVRFVGRKVTEPTLRAAITPAGNDILGPDW
jgi:prepilin-type processing-associated H-X9-DG protein